MDGVQDARHHGQCGTSSEAAQWQKQLRKGIIKKHQQLNLKQCS